MPARRTGDGAGAPDSCGRAPPAAAAQDPLKPGRTSHTLRPSGAARGRTGAPPAPFPFTTRRRPPKHPFQTDEPFKCHKYLGQVFSDSWSSVPELRSSHLGASPPKGNKLRVDDSLTAPALFKCGRNFLDAAWGAPISRNPGSPALQRKDSISSSGQDIIKGILHALKQHERVVFRIPVCLPEAFAPNVLIWRPWQS